MRVNPIFDREDRILLDGEWEFEIDNTAAVSYWRTKHQNREHLSGKITVPYPVESKLSGVENNDFNLSVVYKKKFTLPEKYKNKRIFLNFGAVNYESEVYLNGTFLGRHIGGQTAFKYEITDYIKAGENDITVVVTNEVRDPKVISGKQSVLINGFSAYYSRSTGIWQSVYLEILNDNFIEDFRFKTKINGEVIAELSFDKGAISCELETKVSFNGKTVLSKTETVSGSSYLGVLNIKNPILWEAGNGNLYDVTFTLKKGGEVLDTVYTYFGIREIGFKDNVFMLNGKPLFLRLVLDQGYYQDGIWAAPSEEDIKKDVLLALSCGFNGVRLHQKVFDPKYLYYADKFGLLTWGEFPCMNSSVTDREAISRILPQWLDAMKRDINHPCIVTWSPFNETETNDYFSKALQEPAVLTTVFSATKELDFTRPATDTSGSIHAGKTDIYDIHDYEQNSEVFKEHYLNKYYENLPDHQNRLRKDEPFMVTEYGGVLWDVEQKGNSWGYGLAPESKDEAFSRIEGLTAVLLESNCCTGFCYTQLYDVEQEKNGLFTYGREPKFDVEKLKKVFSKKATVEK